MADKGVGGWSSLGDILGGGAQRARMAGTAQGIDLQRAAMDALARKEQASLYSAQTQDALEKASASRNQNKWREQAAALNAGQLSDPQNTPLGMLIAGGMGGDYNTAAQGLGEMFATQQRRIAADPNTPMDQRQYSLAAVEGKPTNFLDVDSQGQVTDLRNPDAGVQFSRLGEAEIRKRLAEASKPATVVGSPGGAPLLRSSGGVTFQSYDNGQTWSPIADPADLAAAAAARGAGGATGAKQAGLENTLNTLNEFRTLVTDLAGDEQHPRHPAFNTIYGAQSWINPANLLPGTDAQAAKALRDQMASKSFLASIQQMRGMGALSNAEGAKVESALTAALNSNLSPDDAVKSFGALRTSLDNLERVARSEAGAVPSAINTPNQARPGGGALPRVGSDAEYDALPSGTRFTAPDGSTRTKP